MSGVGPPPSANPRRRNEQPEGHLEPGEVPERLKKLRGRSTFGAMTQVWWDVWADCPQAEFFQATDWMRLQMIAPLVDAYFKKPGHYSLAEIRQNESLLGATVMDRMRLRMKPKEDGKGPDELPADVADFMNYRKNA